MSKITEALKNIVPEDQINEVTAAVEEMINEQHKLLEADFNSKLEEAYEQLSQEKTNDEKVAEQGYQQAYEIIGSLMQRIEDQKTEFQTALENGFQEAYEEIQKEKAKNGNIEVTLYDEFDKKLKEMKSFMVDKVDEFLSLQEKEVYESAKRDVLADPQVVEQRVAVSKMAEILSDYMDRDDLNGISSSKLEEAVKEISSLKGQMRIVEARNVKLSAQNNKLNEQVREAEGLLTEASKLERKERELKARNASGRGQRAEGDKFITEFNQPAVDASKQDQNLVEANDPIDDIFYLSGISESK